MTKMTRRTMLLGLGLAATGFGCGMNPFLLPQLLTSEDRESIVQAEYPLVPHNKKNPEVKVIVLASTGPGLHPDLAGVDRMLNSEIISILDSLTKKNEEKVQVLKMTVIDNFKSDHPNWRGMKPYDIGTKYGADYVIDVEIGEMDLYKQGSRGDFLQGRATISVAAYNLAKPLKDPAYRKELRFEYPRFSEIPIETRSRSEVSSFRMSFVQRIATDVALKFTASPADYRRQMD